MLALVHPREGTPTSNHRVLLTMELEGGYGDGPQLAEKSVQVITTSLPSGVESIYPVKAVCSRRITTDRSTWR